MFGSVVRGVSLVVAAVLCLASGATSTQVKEEEYGPRFLQFKPITAHAEEGVTDEDLYVGVLRILAAYMSPGLGVYEKDDKALLVVSNWVAGMSSTIVVAGQESSVKAVYRYALRAIVHEGKLTITVDCRTTEGPGTAQWWMRGVWTDCPGIEERFVDIANDVTRQVLVEAKKRARYRAGAGPAASSAPPSAPPAPAAPSPSTSTPQ